MGDEARDGGRPGVFGLSDVSDVGGTGDEMRDVRRCPLGKLFEQGDRDQPSCAGDRIVRFIPLAGMDGVVGNMKEVTLVERQLLGGRCTVRTEGANDFLWGLNGGERFGERGERTRDVGILFPVAVCIKRLA